MDVSEWQPIETAPKSIVSDMGGSEYGEYFLAYPINGRVARVRWWQSKDEADRKLGYQNFLADGGMAVHPMHWMPLPDPPDAQTKITNDASREIKTGMVP